MNKPIPIFKMLTCRVLVFIILTLLFTSNAYSQIGLGSHASLSNPGLQKSDKYDIRFKTGSGYGFFVRHDVYDSSGTNIDFRYIATLTSHKANLPLGNNAKYDFSLFSMEALANFMIEKSSTLYAGFGIGIMSQLSKDRFRKTYSDQIFYPTVIAGWSYQWAQGFDLFVETKAGYGNSGAGPEKIPVSSLALNFGITMYITE
ncbi:MAG: hypothetical protein D8M58_03720 [Calditrichaeota bacterium]|nr:MAG: hypothetical protein DWQ03_03355 [Calditrichota bacterium]MBL1204475.1 hypothetical protein [Calditrichota bacterium]NOG44304.1 outer membrane beta-barrel protein [Calditrichota bacterium]